MSQHNLVKEKIGPVDRFAEFNAAENQKSPERDGPKRSQSSIVAVNAFEEEALSKQVRFLKRFSQIDKLGSKDIQLTSVMTIRADMKKIASESAALSKKMEQCQRHLAEWINSFKCLELALVAAEYEKVFQFHIEFNKKMSQNLGAFSSSLKNFQENETKRNKALKEFIKDSKALNAYVKGSLDSEDERKLNQNIFGSRKTAEVAQYCYEYDLRVNLRPFMFSYVHEFKNLNTLGIKTANDIKLDLDEFEFQQSSKVYKGFNLSQYSLTQSQTDFANPNKITLDFDISKPFSSSKCTNQSATKIIIPNQEVNRELKFGGTDHNETEVFKQYQESDQGDTEKPYQRDEYISSAGKIIYKSQEPKRPDKYSFYSSNSSDNFAAEVNNEYNYTNNLNEMDAPGKRYQNNLTLNIPPSSSADESIHSSLLSELEREDNEKTQSVVAFQNLAKISDEIPPFSTFSRNYVDMELTLKPRRSVHNKANTFDSQESYSIQQKETIVKKREFNSGSSFFDD